MARNRRRAVSLFFQLATRVRQRRAAKPRDARNEGGSPRWEKSLFFRAFSSQLPNSRLAPSVTRVCILARFVPRTIIKEKWETARSLGQESNRVYFQIWSLVQGLTTKGYFVRLLYKLLLAHSHSSQPNLELALAHKTLWSLGLAIKKVEMSRVRKEKR